MNVIFILSDDHRYDFMGFMNKVTGLQTPHMDHLGYSCIRRRTNEYSLKKAQTKQ